MSERRPSVNIRLLHELKPFRIALGILVACAIAMGALIIGQAAALTHLIEGGFLGRQNLSQLISILLVLLLILVARSVLLWGKTLVAARAAAQVKTSLRVRLFAHLQALGPHFLTSERSGELAMTLVEGVEAVDSFFSQMIPQVLVAVLIPLLIGLVAFVIDPLSGLILLLTMPVLLVFMALLGTMARVHAQKQWRVLGVMSAHLLDVLQGLATLKLFGRSQRQRETIGRVSERFRTTTMGVLRVAFLSALVLELGATLSTAMVAVEIGLRLLYGSMEFAPAFFLLLLTPDFYLPLRALGATFHASQASSASAERLYAILNHPVPQAQPEDPQPVLHALAGSPTLAFRQVTYTYQNEEGDDHPALREVTFSLEAGQTVALVGPSGAGKSTIAHLLLRFLEPQAGEILVNGIPLARIPACVWREQVAWVAQRPFLFNASVAENIGIGRAGATRDEIITAARQAQLHAFIETLPAGYETLLGERGSRLSGGQAQRLAIARALLKPAPILLLDEATAHLDRANEGAVLEILRRCTPERIVVIIAHRLQAMRAVDRILLLDGGRIVADGTHEQVLAHSNTYRELVNASERSCVA